VFFCAHRRAAGDRLSLGFGRFAQRLLVVLQCFRRPGKL